MYIVLFLLLFQTNIVNNNNNNNNTFQNVRDINMKKIVYKSKHFSIITII